MLHLFSRPYPSSIAGVLIDVKVGFEGKNFTMTYSPHQRHNGVEALSEEARTTIIAVNEEVEQVGWGRWNVTLSGDDIAHVSVNRTIERQIRIIVSEEWTGEQVAVALSL